MEKKQRFFIYDRKEVGVLLLLGVMVAVFAFTLGVHLGKRVTGKAAAPAHATPTTGVSPVAEAPSTAETEQAMAQPTAVPSAMIAASEDAVNQATHDEVSRTGIRLEDSKQLELPEKTKSANAGATSLGNKATPHPRATEQKHTASHEVAPHAQATASESAASEDEAPSESIENPQQKEALAELKALNEKASGQKSEKKSEKTHHAASTQATGKFTLQIGSYSNEKDAEERLKDLEISGLSPRIHATDLKSKGRWYRIYLGGFPTKSTAEKAGKKYRAQGVIDSFIVAKSVE